MNKCTGFEAPSDIEDRIARVGSPVGMTVNEIVRALGYPQYELISTERIIKNEPFILIWDTGKRFYPLDFSHDLKCIGIDPVLIKAVSP